MSSTSSWNTPWSILFRRQFSTRAGLPLSDDSSSDDELALNNIRQRQGPFTSKEALAIEAEEFEISMRGIFSLHSNVENFVQFAHLMAVSFESCSCSFSFPFVIKEHKRWPERPNGEETMKKRQQEKVRRFQPQGRSLRGARSPSKQDWFQGDSRLWAPPRCVSDQLLLSWVGVAFHQF